MVVEAIVFFILLYAFISVTAMHRMWLRHRDRRRERWIANALDQIDGKPVAEALDRFGSPFEVIEGRERTFYVWKSPPSERFPVGTGLAIVNVIADAGGQVLQSSWLTR